MDLNVINLILKNKSYDIWENKKTKATIVDGYYRFDLKTKSLTCNCFCKKKICNHVLFYLSTKMDYFLLPIFLVPQVFDKYKDQINKLKRELLENKLVEEYEKLECSICLDNLKGQKLQQCKDCYWIFHYKCNKKWHGDCSICRSHN